MPAPTARVPGPIHPFTGHDVPWLLEARAANRSDHTFLIFAPFDKPAERWTYARFAAAAERVAAGLRARGVTQGDFVLLHMDNCPEFLLTWHACARLGATVVTTNTRSAEDELNYFADHCGARVAITQPKYEALIRAAAPQMKWVAVTELDTGAEPETPRSTAAIPFETLTSSEAPRVELRTPEPLSFNSVQYTSGTTSRPKGVVWTHANALWGARTNAVNCDIAPDDIGHTCLPLYHTNALCYSHLATLWAGATLVIQPRFSASRYWPCLVEHKATWGVQIPFMLKALMPLPVPKDHSLTRWCLGSLNPPVLVQTFGLPIGGWFGMTETIGLPLLTMNGLPGRTGTMGVVTPGYEIEVRREDGTHVAFGESGLMWIRGVQGLSLFHEYLNNPEATAKAFDENGWFLTGDRVTPFEDGHIRFDGRERDMLRIGAENVAESEIERVVMTAGGIIECAVVGKPHPMLDEVAVAYVLTLGPQPDIVERVLAVCKQKLADFKVPREVFVIEEFPRVTLGKIDKKELRRRLAAEENA
ncbi:Crotonobetaine/carnitine--CoA ligase [Alphaproteobacteria bacterium SO-S41]|nr:Crotonobetaine/carnitine--CoA ligase [Alphaproteobacteria bacterium SO-S41]